MRLVPATEAKIILVKGTSLLARLIQYSTSSPYSHCGFLIGPCTYEADVPRVMSRFIMSYAWEYQVYRIKGMTEDKTLQLLQWCRAQLGKPYDYGKVLGLGLEMLLHCTGIRDILDSRCAFSCTEFVWEGLDQVGLKLQLDQTVLRPNDLATDPLLQLER